MFELFSEKIREAIARSRNAVGADGVIRVVPGVDFEPATFRIAGFFDCKDWKTARPGSGPDGDYELAPRRPDAYIKQRAFFGGHHGHHGVKTFTIMTPNGLNFVSNVYSCRRNDCKIVEWTDIDNYLESIFLEAGMTLDDCQKFYGDNGFKSTWKCLVTAHKAAPNVPLGEDLQEENRVMKGPRESIEHSYGQVTQLWNLAMTGKKQFKLDVDSQHVFSQIRLMHFLTNCRTCLRGNLVSSSNALNLYPPNLADYLDGEAGVL
jgi:hypothetical protein